MKDQVTEFCIEFGIDQQRGEYLEKTAKQLFSETTHIHGLTKTSKPLLGLTALVQDTVVTKSSLRGYDSVLKRFFPSLTVSERKIVKDTLLLKIEFQQNNLSILKKIDSLNIRTRIALGLAAILNIVIGLDSSRTQDTSFNGVFDDGNVLEIHVSGGISAFENAERAFNGAKIWNSFMLRPIRSVTVSEGFQPPGIIRPGDRVIDVALRIVQFQLEQYNTRIYGIGYSEDIEYVHELRVALRRLRAVLRVFRMVFSGVTTEFKTDLKKYAGTLGTVRDIDVFLNYLRTYKSEALEQHLPFLKKLITSEQRKRQRSYKSFLNFFNSDESSKFEDNYYKAVKNAIQSVSFVAGSRKSRKFISELAPSVILKPFKTVARKRETLNFFTPEELHDLRINCKKLRYTCEFFNVIYSGKLSNIISHMVQLQDSLGDYHDADIYSDRITNYFNRSVKSLNTEYDIPAVDTLINHIRTWQENSFNESSRIWQSFINTKFLQKSRKIIKRPEALFSGE